MSSYGSADELRSRDQNQEAGIARCIFPSPDKCYHAASSNAFEERPLLTSCKQKQLAARAGSASKPIPWWTALLLMTCSAVQAASDFTRDAGLARSTALHDHRSGDAGRAGGSIVELAVAIERLREDNEALREQLKAPHDRAPSARSAEQLPSALSAGNRAAEAKDLSGLALLLRQDAVLLQAQLYAIAGALDKACVASAVSAAEPAPTGSSQPMQTNPGQPPQGQRAGMEQATTAAQPPVSPGAQPGRISGAAQEPKEDLAALRADRAMPPEGSVGKHAQQPLEYAKETAAKLNAAYREIAQDRERRSERSTGSDSRLKQLQEEVNAAQSVVARLSSAKDVYTVKPGDTLSAIAAAFYGDRTLWPAILRANAHLLGNADAIYPGMVLVIP